MSADAVDPTTSSTRQVDVVREVMHASPAAAAHVDDHHGHAANIAQEQAISMAARRGRISAFFGGLPKNDPFIKCDSTRSTLPPTSIHANRFVAGPQQARPEYISTGQVPVKDRITKKVALADVMSVFDIVSRASHQRSPSSRDPSGETRDPAMYAPERQQLILSAVRGRVEVPLMPRSSVTSETVRH